MGLQEVSAPLRGDFKSQLDHLYQFYDGDDPRNADVILLARDAFTVREHGVEALPSACRGPVRMTYLIAETPSGQVFGVANTHLCRQDPAGSVEQLAGLIARHLAGMPVILLGDLNATEGSEAIDYLMGLATVGDAANPVPLQDSWRLAGTAQSKQEAGAIPIDWILVADGGGLRFEATAAAAVADPAQASDHIAIVADLRLR